MSPTAGASRAAAALLVGLPLGLLTVLAGAGGATSTPTVTGVLIGAIPAPYRPLLERAAGTCPQVGVALLAAVISVESNWNPTAVSPAGAQGIAQFTPDTWAGAGVDGDADGVRDPFNPADAIRAEAGQLCRLLQAVTAAGLPGDPVDLTIAAYNAGLGAVLQARGVPPIPETQAYVVKVRAALASYSGTTTTAGAGGAPRGASPTGAWVAPADGPLTQPFGPNAKGFHPGIDLGVPIGSPVRAAHDGTVLAAGPATGFGLWVVLDHGAGVHTVYGHLSQPQVTVGQPVQAGQQIALSGNTGESSGPHLHFEVRINDQPVDPIAYYAALGRAL